MFQAVLSATKGRTEVVEAPWGQSLREVGGKQKTSEEGEEEVVTVIGQGAGWTAASTAVQKNLNTGGKNRFYYWIKHRLTLIVGALLTQTEK